MRKGSPCVRRTHILVSRLWELPTLLLRLHKPWVSRALGAAMCVFHCWSPCWEPAYVCSFDDCHHGAISHCWSSWLLAAAWPIPAYYYSHMGGEPTDKRSLLWPLILFLSLYPLSKLFFLFPRKGTSRGWCCGIADRAVACSANILWLPV